jgi:hypothetical protein
VTFAWTLLGAALFSAVALVADWGWDRAPAPTALVVAAFLAAVAYGAALRLRGRYPGATGAAYGLGVAAVVGLFLVAAVAL